MEFAAKVDLWFLALFYGSGVLMIGLAPFVRARGAWAAALLAACGVLFVFVGWSVDRMVIVVTPDGHLDARGWPWGGRITHVDRIRSIEPSNDPRASLAASLDRLRVEYGGPNPRDGGLIFIAVHDEQGFLDTVAAASGRLERTRTGVARVAE